MVCGDEFDKLDGSTHGSGEPLPSLARRRCDGCHEAYVDGLVALRERAGEAAVARHCELPET